MHGHEKVTIGKIARGLAVAVIFLTGAFMAGAAPAEEFVEAPGQQLAVPATFVRWVTTPGIADFIKRPTAMHYDRFHQEILVADSGHNRIVVFAASGSYKFEFDLGEHATAPADIVTDPAGYIYVLGSTPQGRVLQRFDFDGLPLGPLDLPQVLDGMPVNPRSMACADDGRIFVLDHLAQRVLIIDPQSGLEGSFGVGVADRINEDFQGLGTMAVNGDELLVPVATEGTVLRYGLDGAYRGSLGHFGSKPGALNFPVSVDVSPEGIVAVLDQGRFCVVCFSAEGRVLGEFGGKGHSPGWFMNPSLLAIPSADKVVIGQIFENKIQVCTMPEFVRGRNRRGANESDAPQGAPEVLTTSHTSRPSAPPSGGSHDPQHHTPVSHLEVSE